MRPMAALSLVHQLKRQCDAAPDREALFRRAAPGQWTATTWQEYWDRARALARALIAAGHRPGECVAIVGPNLPEWVLAQMAVMMAGGVATPLYPTSTGEQLAYILNHAEIRFAFAGSKELVTSLLAAHDDGLALVVGFDEEHRTDDPRSTSMRAFASDLPEEDGEPEVDRRISGLNEETVSLLIYTSGTTGTPKGVELDHGNLLAVTRGCAELYADLFTQEGWRILSYLPLSHVAEQMFTNLLSLEFGGQTYFCPELTELRDYLPEVRPTVFVAVPRVWEKFQAALSARLEAATGLKKHLAAWALREQAAATQSILRGEGSPNHFRIRLARRLVVEKILERLGLGDLMFAATGAAPTRTETMEFFASLGILIHEGFGMTETAGAVTASPYQKPVFGRVGVALPGVEAKVAEDGELLLRGRAMTRGYRNQPAATAELLDDDGWLHTGDLGDIDEHGSIAITGRKKELLITAGGKNVAPVAIEQLVCRMAGIGQAVVVGDRLPYLTALIALDAEASPALAAELGLPGGGLAELAAHSAVTETVQGWIDTEVNPNLARYQTIKKFTILPNEFSVDGGELTPTLKLRRGVIVQKYRDAIDAMYPAAEPASAQA